MDLAQGLGFGVPCSGPGEQMVAWILPGLDIKRWLSGPSQAVLRSLGHCGRHRLDLWERRRQGQHLNMEGGGNSRLPYLAICMEGRNRIYHISHCIPNS